MKRLCYSLPPAGQKIPWMSMVRSVWEDWRGSHGDWLQAIQNFLGAQNVFYLSSGRAALWLILKAISQIQPEKSEVILPAYTCPAVASAILKANLKPVLCDINPDNFGFKIENLKPKMNKRTLGVILVHLFGYPANVLEVQKICREHGLLMIEDAAQAFGNSLSNSPESKLGLLADAGFFSFGRGKPISLMHGGMLTTHSEEIFGEARKAHQDLNHRGSFRNLKYGLSLGSSSLFSNPYMYWIPQRIPSLHLGETIFEPDFIASSGVKLAESLAGRMLGSLEGEKEVRQENSEWYSSNLSDVPWVKPAPSGRFPYLRYPLLVKDEKMRDRLLDLLMSQGTGAALFYPCPLNELQGLKGILQDSSVYPNAKKLSESLITLPVHSGVTERIRNRIRSVVQQGTLPNFSTH